MPIKLPRNNLSDQVSGWLTSAIENGQFKPGDRLPSVEQLAQELSVGRSSIREGLRVLEAKGILSVVHGKGTFVNYPRFDLGSQLISFTEYIQSLGMVPSSIILEREVLEPDFTVREGLNLAEGKQVNHLYRLRLADG